MIICESWLRDWVETDLDARGIADALTLAGLEVDGIEQVSAGIESVVVGRILEVASHPDADRLNVCLVDSGKGSVTVVCGAPNAAPGMLAPYARVGARLPGDVDIKRATVRGVESDGMLCSGAELGLEDESDGLLELGDEYRVGQAIVDALGLDDTSIDIDLTPNRGDCLSILGIARELRVLVGASVKPVDTGAVEQASDNRIGVRVNAPAACPKYLARVVENIDCTAVAPLWMRERLRRCGLRSISPVVDVTNYVMLELGQPMHAFDRDRIQGDIIVRMARKGDEITLLDGSELTAETETLLITDGDGPVAVAGIMGGYDSAVTDATTSVVFEAAHFTRDAIAGKARHYGMQTDSSYRFERGVDPALPFTAIERATSLLLQICGGVAGPIVDVSNEKYIRRPPATVLRYERLCHVLGMDIGRDEVTGILESIARDVTAQPDGWSVVSPGYRFDIECEADLIEEVARVKGYDSVPLRMPRVVARGRVAAEAGATLDSVCSTLVARDYFQAINFGFVDPRMQELLGSGQEAIPLANPIAENLSEMRTSLWPGLVAAAVSNLNRQHERIRLFETGRVFWREGGQIVERDVIAGLAMGPAESGQWGINTREVDFYDVKSDVESLLSLTEKENNFIFISLEHKSMHPGQVARIDKNGSELGWLGRLHPEIQRDAGSDRSVFLFELDLQLLLAGQVPQYRQISRFPAVRRDLALVVDEQVEAGAVAATIRKAAGSALVNLELFDVYEGIRTDAEAGNGSGSGTSVGQRSLAYRLTFQLGDRTLTDAEVEQFVADALAELSERYDVKLRGQV